jgi:retron-type reverse transcriptase
VIKFDDLVEAYFTCRKNKRNTTSALEFEFNQNENLLQLYDDLVTGKYHIGESDCFVTENGNGTKREVWAANFRDRIVQHLVYNHISPKFHSRFIADSCACIPGRGTLYGATRLQSKILRLTANYTKPLYYLKMDLSNFFVSIDKNVVWSLLEPHISDHFIKNLTHTILYNDPKSTANYKSDEKTRAQIEPRKRLELVEGVTRGLPIGNITSQFFANVLLDPLDKFVVHQLKPAGYIRYVDDFILLSSSKEELCELRDKIIQFVPTLGLTINPKKVFIHSVYRGVPFVGHNITKYGRKIINTKRKALLNSDNPEAMIGYMKQFDNEYNLKIKLLRKQMKRYRRSVSFDLNHVI